MESKTLVKPRRVQAPGHVPQGNNFVDSTSAEDVQFKAAA
jgi:hypothetical protein